MSVVAQELVSQAGRRRGSGAGAISSLYFADATERVSKPVVLRPFSALRLLPIGLLAFAQSFAIAWIVYGRTEAPPPQPGDHAWWHSSGPVETAAFEPGLFLALTTVSFYLLLPLLVLAAQVLRRRAGGPAGSDGRSLPTQLGFAIAATVAGAIVTVPAVVLARAFGPEGGAPLWSAVSADAVTALRLCALLALLVVFVAGVPWAQRASGAEAPSLPRESGSAHAESS